MSPLIGIFTEDDTLNIHNKIVLCFVSVAVMIQDQIKPSLASTYAAPQSQEWTLFYNDRKFTLMLYFLPAALSAGSTLIISGEGTGFDYVYDYVRIGFVTIYCSLLWILISFFIATAITGMYLYFLSRSLSPNIKT